MSYLSTGDQIGTSRQGENPWGLHTVYRTSETVSGAALLIKYDGAQCAWQRSHITVNWHNAICYFQEKHLYLAASQINSFVLVFEFSFYLFLY
jgi:hypothetical protein